LSHRTIVLRPALLSLFVALGLAGCGTLESSHVLTGAPRAQSAGARVVMEGQGTPASFQEIAILQTVGSGHYANLADVVAELRDHAARLGCTIVVNVRVDTGSATSSGTGVCGVD